MTSCFNTVELVGQNQRRRYFKSNSPGGGTRSVVAVYDCTLVEQRNVEL